MRRFLAKGPWVWTVLGRARQRRSGFLGPCAKLTDGPFSFQCGTGPLFIKMSQTDPVFKLIYVFKSFFLSVSPKSPPIRPNSRGIRLVLKHESLR